MTRQIGVLEAKTSFSALVADVERTGEEITVTRHGKPAVRIIAVRQPPSLSPEDRAALVQDIIRSRDEIASRHPDAEPFDIREALDRDRGEEWS